MAKGGARAGEVTTKTPGPHNSFYALCLSCSSRQELDIAPSGPYMFLALLYIAQLAQDRAAARRSLLDDVTRLSPKKPKHSLRLLLGWSPWPQVVLGSQR